MAIDQTAPPPAAASSLPPGRVDIHCHLLPGVDDGCPDVEESLACVRRLIETGYVGSICTPHIWPDLYPDNTWPRIEAWTADLQAAINAAGLAYRLWPGGEIRLFKGMDDYFAGQPIPTLAGSRWVLVDYWESSMQRWVLPVLQSLVRKGHSVILAHPERVRCPDELARLLPEILRLGVKLQGNFACMTGEEGYAADRLVRQWLHEGLYQFMALDLHDSETLEGRLDGLQLVAAEFGPALLDRFTIEAPRRLILPPG